jgi:lipopolysaccharide/colanic/teichoic acid biosynthesis glycosyltransferase
MDVLLAGMAVVGMAPLLLGIFAIIRIFDRGPAIFSQVRIGRDGRVFMIYKFRSMLLSDPAAAAEWRSFQKLRNDPRITPIGRFLRRSSLDELPQLLNILRGDMSIIGPRPVAPDELQRYGANAHLYMAVRPGVLGLWQVRGRNKLTYAQRVALDAEYVRTWSILADLRILLEAVPVVLLGKGAY